MEQQSINTTTAKLARGKGLPESSHFAYLESKDLYFPTQSQLQRWLREQHNIYVEVTIDTYRDPNTLAVTINKVNDGVTHIKKTIHPWEEIPHYSLDEYEQALEHGLQEALKLIK